MANAIELAAMALLPKLLQNLPPEIAATIGQIGQIALSLKTQVDRIEANQALIMKHLNISPVFEILTKDEHDGKGR